VGVRGGSSAARATRRRHFGGGSSLKDERRRRARDREGGGAHFVGRERGVSRIVISSFRWVVDLVNSHMATFRWVVDLINSHMTNCLWNDYERHKKMHLANWHLICMKKEYGGSGSLI
jgi:hypothetical protein